VHIKSLHIIIIIIIKISSPSYIWPKLSHTATTQSISDSSVFCD